MAGLCSGIQVPAKGSIWQCKAYQKLYFEFKAKFQEVSADLRQAIGLGCDTVSICFPNGGVPLFGGCYSPD